MPDPVLPGRNPVPQAGNGAVQARDAARAAMLEAEKATLPPALAVLGRLFCLSRFELDLLLLCAGMELDTRVAALCAGIRAGAGRPFPSFALAMAVFDEPRWDVLSADRPLRHWRLVEISQPGAEPLTTSPLRADERIVNYIKGLNTLDDRLLPLLVESDECGDTGTLPRSQQDAADRIARYLMEPSGPGRIPVIELLGPDSAGKRLVARHAAAALGRHLFRIPQELIPAGPDELGTLARLWERESILLPIALCIERGDLQAEIPAPGRFLARTGGVIFLDVRDRTPLPCPFAAVDIAKPTPAEQAKIWQEASAAVDAGYAGVLAGQFSLDVPAIRQIAAAVPAGPDPEAYRKDLWKACVESTRPRLDLLAQRIEPRAVLADMVLPDRELRLIREIASQVKYRTIVYDDWGFRQKMNRGLGISALFAGESGTGKTMAAEAIAGELGLGLYRIDLSQVVSKYIGETEKNLRRLFDAAEDGGAILFFDEADALFGKRSEVKDSHDRYANIEINYLLQRMEAYSGLAILATNAKQFLDPAFVRRLRFIVNFPYPGPAERRAIWTKVFPGHVPRDELDLDRLARFNLTGGSIHNIALNAAFLAAGASVPVGMRHVLDATRTEMLKADRPVIEAEFR
jgi:hypothetical protein